jgi:hypothetical protein
MLSRCALLFAIVVAISWVASVSAKSPEVTTNLRVEFKSTPAITQEFHQPEIVAPPVASPASHSDRTPPRLPPIWAATWIIANNVP